MNISAKEEHLRHLIENAIKNRESGSHYKEKSADELLQEINVYHQELEYQNEELRRINIELENSHLRYVDLFENAPLGYLLLDKDFFILEANKWFVDKFSFYPPKNLFSFTEFIHPSFQDDFYLKTREIFTNGPGISLSLTLKLRFRNIEIDCVIEISKQLKKDVINYKLTITDITDKIKAYEDLKTSENRFSQVADISDEIIWETDTEGLLLYVSAAFSRLTGYNADDIVLNKHLYELIPPELFNEFRDVLNYHLDNKAPINHLESVFLSAEKKYVFIEINAIPVYSQKGGFTGFIGISRDITNEKQMMNSLVEAKNKAEEMMKVKSFFLANMSHEIRTPLVAILGYAELLESELPADSELLQFASNILAGGHRLLDTLTMILNLSKLESKVNEINIKAANIIPLLHDVFLLFKPIAVKKSLLMSFNTKYEIINCNIDVTVFSNIFNNLLNNAVKFTSAGEISISVNVDNEFVEISVEDTGIGIDADKQKIIFDEFRQVSEGMSRGFEGTGLGLTLVKKYCEILGASVEVSSIRGTGSIFTVRIPMIEKNMRFQSVKEVPGFYSDDLVIDTKLKLLYVEDDHFSAEFVKLILQPYYDIDVADSFIQASELINKFNYDGFLIDLNLKSVKTGVDFADLLRSDIDLRIIPRIALTAYGTEHPDYDEIKTRFNIFIAKPFKKRDFISKINNFFYAKNTGYKHN